MHLMLDSSGASGVEFALVLPILFCLLAGTAELGQALTVSRKIDEIASTTGDIISQQSTWTKPKIASLLAGTRSILQPYDTNGVTITVAVADIGSSGAATVNWSAAFNTPPLAAGTEPPIEVPAQIREVGVQVVVTRVQYTFATPVSALFSSFAGRDGYRFDRYFFNRPRVGNTISYQ